MNIFIWIFLRDAPFSLCKKETKIRNKSCGKYECYEKRGNRAISSFAFPSGSKEGSTPASAECATLADVSIARCVDNHQKYSWITSIFIYVGRYVVNLKNINFLICLIIGFDVRVPGTQFLKLPYVNEL